MKTRMRKRVRLATRREREAEDFCTRVHNVFSKLYDLRSDYAPCPTCKNDLGFTLCAVRYQTVLDVIEMFKTELDVQSPDILQEFVNSMIYTEAERKLRSLGEKLGRVDLKNGLADKSQCN